MDKTIRTIRSEIEKDKEGIIPDVTLVIDTTYIPHVFLQKDLFLQNGK